MNLLKHYYVLLFLLFFNLICSAQLKVILKLDDLIALNNVNSFKKTTDYLISKKVKASLGIIGNRLDMKSRNTLADVISAKDSTGNDLFEIWHHGYDHIIPEFKDRDFDYQNDHFKKGDEYVLKFIGIQMNTFGTPGNANDSITNTVIKNYDNYHVYFYNSYKDKNKSSNLVSLNQRVEIEDGTGNVNFDFFIKNFTTYKKYWKDYIVLQGHPNAWDDTKLEEFSKVIDYLLKEKIEIVLPNEYYLSLRDLKAPIITNVNVKNNKAFISWKNNDDINNYYVVEKSNDGILWEFVGKQYALKNESYIFTDENLKNNTNTFYRIRINSSFSNVVYSNTFNLEVKDLLNNKVKYEILSNPIKNSLDIRFNFKDVKNISLELYNTNGDVFFQTNHKKIIELTKNNVTSINLLYLEPGVYFCKIIIDNQTYLKKIIKL